MVNSCEVSSNAQNSNINPTSEVGSVPIIAVQKLTNIVRKLIQSLVRKSCTEPKYLSLSRFNPETAGSDPAAWCAAVNLIMKENLLPSSALRGNYNFNNERQVDFYVVEASTGRRSHLGESFPFYSDFGAECSLIKESVVLRSSGKRTIDIVTNRGTKNICIKCTSQTLFIACTNGFAL